MANVRTGIAYVLKPHSGAVEALALAALYGVYELTRGTFGESWSLAQRHAHEIVRFERDLGMFWEWDVQRWAQSLPGLPAVLGLAYIGLHVAATIAALVWVYRRHRERFALLRTVLVASSAFALVLYAVYPTAPPRLAGLGIADTVTDHAGINLNSQLLGALYNPIAAVPSLHFGYALIVGVTVAALSPRRSVRVLGALYPLVMLFVIVATGNHFWVDAAAGGLVVVVAWLVAQPMVRRTEPLMRPPAAAGC
jgi:PAP2 superfamily protein